MGLDSIWFSWRTVWYCHVEDALYAARAAVEEGVVAGSGVALLRTRQNVGAIKGDNADQEAGIRLALKAIVAPLREIIANAGGKPANQKDKRHLQSVGSSERLK